jgi:hypothetical protein
MKTFAAGSCHVAPINVRFRRDTNVFSWRVSDIAARHSGGVALRDALTVYKTSVQL